MGQEIKVLGETYSLDDQEDSAVKTITSEPYPYPYPDPYPYPYPLTRRARSRC